jgi:hypothetical protein
MRVEPAGFADHAEAGALGRVAQKGPTPKSQIPSTKSQEESVQAPQLLYEHTTLNRIFLVGQVIAH